jgi:hypothetical protein
LAADAVELRTFTEDTGLIDLGGTYQAFCEPGEVALSGGFDAELGLIDLDGIELPIIGDLIGLTIDLTQLDNALAAVSAVNVTASRPIIDGERFGWEIQTTAAVAGEVTLSVVCASTS